MSLALWCGPSPVGGVSTVAVTMNEILLRGCTLKNSGCVHGVVIYTGAESRIQMNAAAPPRKVGASLCSHADSALIVGSGVCVQDPAVYLACKPAWPGLSSQ